MKCLNLGCGTRFHGAWTNIDVVSTGPGVIAHDLSRGIPLADESYDVVYHSHVLEHLRQPDAFLLLTECLRVLRPGGVLRIVVPDLERICRVYLEKLKAARAGTASAESKYDWIVLELYDQTVREQTGGEMMRYLAQIEPVDAAFVFERIGEEGRALVRQLRCGASEQPGRVVSSRIRQRLSKAAAATQERAIRFFLGADGARAWHIGRFRLAGEVHHWMYDGFSLTRLVKRAGFVDVAIESAHTSRIPDWTSFHLDTLPDGTVCKPDSLFLEAIRPPAEARRSPVH